MSERRRSDLVRQLARLNEELERRGGRPTYQMEDTERKSVEELEQMVDQTLHDVRALREWE